jgi:hypothetical protein
MKTAARLLAFASLLLTTTSLLTPDARAQHARIAKGDIAVFRSGHGHLTNTDAGVILGEGFYLSYGQRDGAQAMGPTACALAPCAPGTVVELPGYLALGAGFFSGNCSASDLASGFSGAARSIGQALFTHDEVALPDDLTPADSFVTLRTPFSLTGDLWVGIHAQSPQTFEHIYNGTLRGQGVMLLHFYRSGDGYLLDRVVFKFNAGPGPRLDATKLKGGDAAAKN